MSSQTRRRVPTRNRMGWASRHLSPPGEEFVRLCSSGLSLPVLDIGAGLGTAALAALAAGARVIANDLDLSHLSAILDATPETDRERLTLLEGAFPALTFADHSLAAAHASSVLHFLNGRQIESGFRWLARWIAPGGRMFVQAATPYQQPFTPFLAEYQRRVAAGEKWPGWITKLSDYCQHRQVGQMPRSIHLLDETVLARAAAQAGLIVERAWTYRRDDLPKSIQLDGREAVGLIARASPLHLPETHSRSEDTIDR